jgi:large subunit ribosomal protein L17
LGIRPGDNAEKALIELVDFNEIYGNTVAKATEPAKKTRRAGTRKKAETAASTEAAPVTEASAEVTEEPKTEE